MDNKEKLDNPLVVHNKDDASYKGSDDAVTMNVTHDKHSGPTLERHRFKKDSSKASKVRLTVTILIIVALAVAFCVLYLTGNISFNGAKTSATPDESISESTTTLQQAYEGTIVIKGTYIFVDGEEVDGIGGMQEALRYQEASTTAYVIINDSADQNFLDNEVLPILMQMNFYDEKTTIKHKSTLLESSDMTTTEQVTESETQETEASQDETE